MRTRLVRVRRKPGGVLWALAFLLLSMAVYIRVSLPALKKMQTESAGGVQSGQRVTEEVRIAPVEIYLVSFGGYDVMNSAKVEAARYVSRGAAGYILKRDRLYVIGAGYSEREDAEKACVFLAAQEGLACAVMEAVSGEVVMRMTAGERQIEAFVEAESTLRRCAELMGALAFSVDGGSATLQQAQEVVRTELAKVGSAKQKLDAQSGGNENEVFRGMSSLLAEMGRQMEEMLKEKKTMGISARLKYACVDITVREAEMMNALGR